MPMDRKAIMDAMRPARGSFFRVPTKLGDVQRAWKNRQQQMAMTHAVTSLDCCSSEKRCSNGF